jgi:hypothetical protein
MNNHTKEFLTKLSNLLEEYKANLEIEGDSYSGGPMQITLEVLNPQSFDEHYDEYLAQHPGEKYPHDGHVLYSYAEWVDLGFHVDADKIKGLLK